jgi:hypothetical protein
MVIACCPAARKVNAPSEVFIAVMAVYVSKNDEKESNALCYY